MNKFLASIILSLTLATSIDAHELEFYVGQSNNDWAFNITGKGRSLIGEKLIYTRIENLKITNNPKHSKTKHIEYVSVGYGYRRENGQWDIEQVATRHNVNESIGAGEWMTLHNLDAVLSIKERPAREYWIVIVVGDEKKSTVYAHSRNDIFQ